MKRNLLPVMIIMMIVIIADNLFAEQNFDETMNQITHEYLKIKDALASDKTEGVTAAAKMMLPLIEKLELTNVPEEQQTKFKKIPDKLSSATTELTKAKDIKAMRTSFNDLSKPMALWASITLPEGVNVAYCPMAPGSWLQTGKEIRNPYYGAKMLKCGEIVSVGKKGCPPNCTRSCCADEQKTGSHICEEKCEHNPEMMKDHKCNESCDHHQKMENKHVCDENCDHAGCHKRI